MTAGHFLNGLSSYMRLSLVGFPFDICKRGMEHSRVERTETCFWTWLKRKQVVGGGIIPAKRLSRNPRDLEMTWWWNSWSGQLQVPGARYQVPAHSPESPALPWLLCDVEQSGSHCRVPCLGLCRTAQLCTNALWVEVRGATGFPSTVVV